MLCAQCHQREATIQFRTVIDGTEEETVHLCKDCAPPTGFDLDKLDLKDIEALSLIGEKCEFCGRDAFSGEMLAKVERLTGASIVGRNWGASSRICLSLSGLTCCSGAKTRVPSYRFGLIL